MGLGLLTPLSVCHSQSYSYIIPLLNYFIFHICLRYVISPSTVVTFLSHTYSLALCLDLSPSAATVDCVEGVTLLDEILTSFKYFNSILLFTTMFLNILTMFS